MKKQNCLRYLIFVIAVFICPAHLHAQPPQRGAGNVRVRTDAGQMKEVRLYDGSYALVVGESDYSAGWDVLPGVKTDVAEVSKALNNQGFTVETSLSLPSDQLKARIDKFIRDYGYQEKNRLLIYFAGHGHTQKSNDGRDLGYIIPVDTPLPEKDDLGFRRKAISMDTIQGYALQIEAKHAIFIFDSCFSGRLISRDKITIPPVIQEDVDKPVRQFITAGSANQPVPDDSIFRKAFVRALAGEADRNGDGYITGSELADYLKEKVTNATDRAQTPQYGKIRNIDLEQGDFVFILPRTQTIAETPVKTPSSKILDSLKLLPEKPKDDPNSQSIYDSLALNKPSTPDNASIGKKVNLPSLSQLSVNAAEEGFKNFDAANYQKAYKNFDQAINLDKNNAAAYQGRGMTNYFLNNNNEALGDLTAAIALNPKDWAAYKYRSFINRRLGREAERVSDDEMSRKVHIETIKNDVRVSHDPLAAIDALNYVSLNFKWNAGSAKLNDESQSAVADAADLLKLMPAGTIVEIGSHSDNAGSQRANLQLTNDRAAALAKALIALGVNSSMLATKGYGDTKPIASNSTEEGKIQNRRIEFKIVNR